MKFIVNRVIVAFLLVALAGAAAFGKSKRATVSFDVDTRVNGTLLKSGTYEVVFDEQTGELSILKGSKVLVKTAARLAMRDGKGRTQEIHTVMEGEKTAFVGIAFSGSDQKVLVTQAGMQAGGN